MATDFRDEIRQLADQMAQMASAQTQTAVVLERLSGRMDGIDLRLKSQEQRPASMREWSNLWILLIGLGVSVLCGVSGLVVALVNVFASHWH